MLVVGNFRSSCGGGADACTYKVQIDGADVPGASAANNAMGSEQLTVVGLTASLATGPHTIALLASGTSPVASQITLAGILLQ